ncbi:MAG: TMEM175 family protein [Acetobacteraceae bacterium]
MCKASRGTLRDQRTTTARPERDDRRSLARAETTAQGGVAERRQCHPALVAFSDGVIAVMITIMVLELRANDGPTPAASVWPHGRLP